MAAMRALRAERFSLSLGGDASFEHVAAGVFASVSVPAVVSAFSSPLGGGQVVLPSRMRRRCSMAAAALVVAMFLRACVSWAGAGSWASMAAVPATKEHV
eukprot:7848424-Pyramimonas_sp.AAC.1